MKVEFDENKSQRNAKEWRLPFTMAADFDFSTARAVEDLRSRYPERRFVALGYIGRRLHVLCFTPIVDGIRVTSLRKANTREVKIYGKEKSD
ncbi:MAG: BrnT family toxin [Candidatus Binataceae bacterium]